jgi:hypothetical protein
MRAAPTFHRYRTCKQEIGNTAVQDGVQNDAITFQDKVVSDGLIPRYEEFGAMVRRNYNAELEILHQ